MKNIDNILYDLYDNNDEINTINTTKILKAIITKNNNKFLTDYKVFESKLKLHTHFKPQINTIIVELNYLKYIVEEYIKIMRTDKIKNDKLFKIYNYLFVLLHENAHSKQYLKAKKIIPSFECETKIYNDITNLLYNNNRYEIITTLLALYRIICYNINSVNFVLERNANIDAVIQLLKLDSINKYRDDEITKIYNELLYALANQGYDKDGTVNYSYNKLLLNKRKIIISDNLGFSDKIKIGLSLNKEEKEILKDKNELIKKLTI